ncbi:ribulose phosphate epimerase [Nannocystaceae bacterium ST9]
MACSTLACTPGPLGADDEAGVTTAMDESDSSSTSSSSEGVEESGLDDAGWEAIGLPADFMPQPCDVWAQDCAEGEKCVAYDSSGSDTWDAYKCVPVLGDQHAGEPCTSTGIVESTDDCDASSYCFDTTEIDGQLVGTCYTQCMGSLSEPTCPATTECAISDSAALVLCIPTCDPLVQDCGAGKGCYWANDSFNCVVTTEDLPTGAPCGFINDCAPGNLCVDGSSLPSCEGSACCTHYCDLQLGDAGCADQPETLCVAFFEQGMAPPEYVNVGVCVIPE